MVQKVSWRIFILILIVVFSLSLITTHAQEPNLEPIIQQLQQKIKALEQQIADLQKQLEVTKTAEARISEIAKFTKTLQRGMTGNEVRELQEFLKQFPDIYPEGLVTGYFGPLTEAAVIRLQERNNIETVGIVGPKTRAKLNELVVSGAGSSGVVPSGLVAAGIQESIATSTATTTAPLIAITTTPSGTIPATPAEPATPATPPSGGGGGATPAIPATPAVPASPAQPSPPPPPPQDITPPTISNIQATNITTTSATIIWTTNESASSEVYYTASSTISVATSTIKVTGENDVTSHSVSLTGLSSNKTHYYIAVSKDAAGNTATSSEQSFVTLPLPSIQSSTIWIRQFGGNGNDHAWGVTADGNSIYIVGDTPTGLDGQINAGSSDGFIAEYDNNGNKIWIRLLGSSGSDYLKGVASNGTNIYAVGNTGGSFDGQINAGNSDAIIAKYDNNGNKVWVKQFGATLSDQLYNVVIDASGNVYASGLTNTSLDGQNNSGFMDALLVKYDKDGNKLWTRLLGTASYDSAEGLAVDSAGNVYMAGWARAALEGQTYAGGDDLFVAKYNSAGDRLWIKQDGTSGTDYGFGVGTDSSGNIYVSGYTNGSLDGQPNAGGFDAFVVKYDNAGNKLWTRQVGGPGNEILGRIAVDQNGNSFVAGYINGSAPSYDGVATAGEQDAYITKFDTQGNKAWSRILGTTDSESGVNVATDNAGSVFLSGYTYGIFSGQVSSGASDVFVAKYSAE